jgi:hypothetical protein
MERRGEGKVSRAERKKERGAGAEKGAEIRKEGALERKRVGRKIERVKGGERTQENLKEWGRR